MSYFLKYHIPSRAWDEKNGNDFVCFSSLWATCGSLSWDMYGSWIRMNRKVCLYLSFITTYAIVCFSLPHLSGCQTICAMLFCRRVLFVKHIKFVCIDFVYVIGFFASKTASRQQNKMSCRWDTQCSNLYNPTSLFVFLIRVESFHACSSIG